MSMEKRQCVCCGAPIQLYSNKCEYCGMVYEDDYWKGTVRYVPVHMGRKRLAARVALDDELTDRRGIPTEAVASYVKKDLVKQIAEGLSEMMTIRMEHDIFHRVTIVEGEVWVEQPDRRAAMSRW